MDPISAIGLTAAVVGLADVISKSVGSLLDFQSRYKQVDLKVNLLIGQLSTLKAALSQIAQLNAKLAPIPQHEQLVQNLAVSLGCCG
jgi:cystathionine beta-lyase family protein involved in aluminum resistance